MAKERKREGMKGKGYMKRQINHKQIPREGKRKERNEE